MLLGLEEENIKYKELLIPVVKKDGSDSYFAVFNEPELLEKNGGKPLYLKIEAIYPYFEKYGDLRLYYYFETLIYLISLMCLKRNNKGI